MLVFTRIIQGFIKEWCGFNIKSKESRLGYIKNFYFIRILNWNGFILKSYNSMCPPLVALQTSNLWSSILCATCLLLPMILPHKSFPLNEQHHESSETIRCLLHSPKGKKWHGVKSGLLSLCYRWSPRTLPFLYRSSFYDLFTPTCFVIFVRWIFVE